MRVRMYGTPMVQSQLPPGQRALAGFPRFGTHLHRSAPAVPDQPVIEIRGAGVGPSLFPLERLATMERREQLSDFHCVAGWSATDLRWEGVAFSRFYREIVEPSLPSNAVVTHLGFGGLDGYRSFACLEDALAQDVLIADRLDGQPLSADHGAPVRLVSPSQYGFVSTKHLSLIELRSSPPTKTFGNTPLIQAHPRARVWAEERHRYLPARALRPVYRLIIPPLVALCARGAEDADDTR